MDVSSVQECHGKLGGRDTLCVEYWWRQLLGGSLASSTPGCNLILEFGFVFLGLNGLPHGDVYDELFAPHSYLLRGVSIFSARLTLLCTRPLCSILCSIVVVSPESTYGLDGSRNIIGVSRLATVTADVGERDLPMVFLVSHTERCR